VPQAELTKLLEGLGGGAIGMDCSVTRTRLPDVFLISTTDFFYPLVHDPYFQGKIGCANVLSDLYAMGVIDCDNLLMLLAASTDMQPTERHIVTRMMIEGFNDQARDAGVLVTGGQTVLNPWPIIGGIGTSLAKAGDFIMPENLHAEDVLVLTKPLGTQLAVNSFQWLRQPEKWARYADGVVSRQQVIDAYTKAARNMARLNRNAARLMHKYGAHGATDVTGFGILGHARNLAKHQAKAVKIEIHTLPILMHMADVSKKAPFFKLLEGFSAETSGGLLLALPQANADAFCQELQLLDKAPAWIVGRVLQADSDARTADIVSDVRILHV